MENLNHSVSNRFPEAQASCTLGISYHAWLLLGLPQPLPKELKPFEAIVGNKHTAPATEGDLHFHIRAHNQSLTHDMQMAISQ